MTKKEEHSFDFADITIEPSNYAADDYLPLRRDHRQKPRSGMSPIGPPPYMTYFYDGIGG